MPAKPCIKIFIASSNELKTEREKCILEINKLKKIHKHLELEPVEWEYDMIPGNYPGHETIQDAINPKLKECQLIIFIFHSKIGKYTRQEFDYASSENKKLVAFFKIGFSPRKQEIEAYADLLDFRESLNETVLYQDFDSITKFESLFYTALNHYFSENHILVVNDEEKATTVALSQSNLELIKLLAEKEKEIGALKESIKQNPGAALDLELQQLVKDKNTIKEELLQSEEIRKQQAKEKEELEKQLLPQKAKDNLKAKALEEVKKGNYAEAESWLKESAKENIIETASTFFELAKIKKLQFQYAEAFNYYELAIKVNPNDSLYQNEAGIMANTLGFFNKAIEYFEKALSINKKSLGEDHPSIAINFNNLGYTYEIKGEYDKAIKYFQNALVIDKKYFGEDHPDIAIDYNNLGGAYDSRGEYDKAIGYYEKALSIDKKSHEEEHPTIAIGYNNLGLAYDNKGEHDKAIEYYNKSLAIGKKFYGEEHPDIAVDYNNLGGAYDNKGEHDKAIEYYEKALTIGKFFYGEEHPKIAIRYNNIGTSYRSKGDYDKAIDYYERSLAIFKKFLEADHPYLLVVEENLASAKKSLKDKGR